MSKDFKKSFDKVKPEKASYDKMFSEIINPEGKKHNVNKYPVFAAAMVIVIILVSFVISFGGIVNTPDNPMPTADAIDDNKIAYKVVLSVNPDVEFSLDKNDMIIEVKGLNADGEKLIEGIDFDGLSLENGTIIVVNQLIINGYISAYSIEREIQLYFSENSDLDALHVMSDIVNAGTAGYSLNSAQNQLNEKSLTIRYWSEAGNVEVPVPAQSVYKLILDYDLRDGYIDMIDVYINDEKRLGDFIDCSGMDADDATLYFFEELFEKGYIRDDVEIEYTFDNITEADYNHLAQLIDALVSYHGIKVKVVPSQNESIISLIYEDMDVAPAETKYTMMQLLSPMINKSEGNIAPVQMEILKMCFTDEEIKEKLKPRIYVVVPNIEGLDEDTALYLLELAGITPRRVEEEYDGNWALNSDNPLYNTDYLGVVLEQDITAGTTYRQGVNFMYWVLVDNVDEPNEKDNDPEKDFNGENDKYNDEVLTGNLFEIYGETCLNDIQKVIFETSGLGEKKMLLSKDFIDELDAALNNITFGPVNVPEDEITQDMEKYSIAINTETNEYNIIVFDWKGEYIAIIDFEYMSADSKAIDYLFEICANYQAEKELTYDDIVNKFYAMIDYAGASSPNEISASKYFIAREQTRIDTWDSNFADINGTNDVNIDYEDIKNIFHSITALSPFSSIPLYRSVELIGVKGGPFEDTDYVMNSEFRVELIYDDFFIHMYADNNTVYLRSRIDDEWYTAIVTEACYNYEKIHHDFISLLGGEDAQPVNFDDLLETTKITIYYVKQKDYKDYPENGALSKMVIRDEKVIADIVSAIQNSSTPICPYPSREGADMVFHTPNGDIWAKIKNYKNPSEMDGETRKYVLSEPTIIFGGYYWFYNAELYEILFDD